MKYWISGLLLILGAFLAGMKLADKNLQVTIKAPKGPIIRTECMVDYPKIQEFPTFWWGERPTIIVDDDYTTVHMRKALNHISCLSFNGQTGQIGPNYFEKECWPEWKRPTSGYVEVKQ